MKITGPMCSMETSGTIGGVITAGVWRRRQWFKKRTSPRTAYTVNQVSARARLGFLKANWRHLDDFGGPGTQASWEAITDRETSSPYHTYLSYNFQRWTSFLGPTISPTYAIDNAFGTSVFLRHATGNAAGLRSSPVNNNTNWGAIYYIMDPADLAFRVDQIWYVDSHWPPDNRFRWPELQNIPDGTWTLYNQTISRMGIFHSPRNIGTFTFPLIFP